MNLEEMGAKTQVKDDYSINIAEGEYLAINVPILYGSPASRFDHPNIASTQRMVLEFKHYARNGRKWWTSKPGVSYLFIVHKSKIILNEEKSGYSYVHVTINGQDYFLSVTGGTSGNGWTDYVSQGSHTFVLKSAKSLKGIAEAATLDSGMKIPQRAMSEEEREDYQRMCAYYDTKGKINIGSKIILKSNLFVAGKQGEVLFVTDKPKGKRHYICGSYPSNVRVYKKHIDWVETAKKNNLELISI